MWLQNIHQHQKQEEESIDTALAEKNDFPWQLIVWNDDVNTFDWVITSLMEICHHNRKQAEQCALFIHFRGKYAVKHGEYDKLQPMCEALHDRGISATVEESVES